VSYVPALMAFGGRTLRAASPNCPDQEYWSDRVLGCEP